MVLGIVRIWVSLISSLDYSYNDLSWHLFCVMLITFNLVFLQIVSDSSIFFSSSFF